MAICFIFYLKIYWDKHVLGSVMWSDKEFISNCCSPLVRSNGWVITSHTGSTLSHPSPTPILFQQGLEIDIFPLLLVALGAPLQESDESTQTSWLSPKIKPSNRESGGRELRLRVTVLRGFIMCFLLISSSYYINPAFLISQCFWTITSFFSCVTLILVSENALIKIEWRLRNC